MPAGASTTRSRSYVLLPQARPMATNHLKSQGLYEAHTDTYQPSETRVHTLAWRDRQTRHRDRDRDRDIDTCTQMFGCKPICKHLSSKAGQYANKIQQVKLSQIESNLHLVSCQYLPVWKTPHGSAPLHSWPCRPSTCSISGWNSITGHSWRQGEKWWKRILQDVAIYIYIFTYLYLCTYGHIVNYVYPYIYK